MAKSLYDFANARLSIDGGATWQDVSSYLYGLPAAKPKKTGWKFHDYSPKRPDTVIVDDPEPPTESTMNLYEVAVIDLGDDTLDPEVPASILMGPTAVLASTSDVAKTEAIRMADVDTDVPSSRLEVRVKSF